MIATKKIRYCPECGRTLDRYHRLCSECAEVNRQLSMDISRHTWSQTEKGIKYYADYLAKYEQLPKRKAYKKDYEKTRVEYHREYKRKKRESMKI
jgi:predicted amidophosphoribosyltransferase